MLTRRKGSLVIVGTLIMSMLLLGCGSQKAPTGQSSAPAPSGEKKPVTLKLAHGLSPTDIHGKAYQYYADQIAEMSKGEIKIEVFPGGALAGNPQMFKAVQSGVADIGIFPSSFVAPQMKEVTIFEIPGIFDPTKVREIEAKIAPVMEKIHAKYGMKYLWPTSEGELVLGVSKKIGAPVKNLDGIKGLKIRDYGQWIGRTLGAWGAVQTTIPPADLNAALDRGTVEGSVASWSFSYGFKVHEQAPNFTLFGTNNMWHWAAISENSWKKLNPEQQKILVEAGKKAMDYSIKIEMEDKELFKKAVKDVGGQLYEITPQEREAFIAKTAPIIDDIRKMSGPEGNELIDILQKK
jgi:TRAP-type C4-dicarboxylate transport system substrate-binding protein